MRDETGRGAVSASARPSGSGRLSAAELARRVRKRRPMYFAVGASYAFDGTLLLLFAAIGATSMMAPMAFLGLGLAQFALTLALSETGFNDRFHDHYLTVPQALAGITVELAAIAVAPEVGVLFIGLIFVVLSFGALRLTAAQTALVWSFAAVGLFALFLLGDPAIGLPMSTMPERLLSLIGVLGALARFCIMGLYGSDLRKKFYDRGKQLSEANRRIAEMAELDELTGALNRRSIMAALDGEVAAAASSHGPCAVALIDLDHFKAINDRFGHPVGDEVLRTFAVNMAANIRSVDLFGRYGGEEFLLVLPGLGEAGAVVALDRVRQIIEGINWAAIAPGMRLTLSAGVCEAAEQPADNILARADIALYRAKDEGRNRVIAASACAEIAAPPLQPELFAPAVAAEVTIAADI